MDRLRVGFHGQDTVPIPRVVTGAACGPAATMSLWYTKRPPSPP